MRFICCFHDDDDDDNDNECVWFYACPHTGAWNIVDDHPAIPEERMRYIRAECLRQEKVLLVILSQVNEQGNMMSFGNIDAPPEIAKALEIGRVSSLMKTWKL